MVCLCIDERNYELRQYIYVLILYKKFAQVVGQTATLHPHPPTQKFEQGCSRRLVFIKNRPLTQSFGLLLKHWKNSCQSMALNKCGFDKVLKLTPLLKHRNYPLVSYNFIYFLAFILLPENSMVLSNDYCGTDLYICERNVRL